MLFLVFFSLHIRSGILKWQTKRVLVFLSNNDKLYVPARFFFQCTKFQHEGSPGPLDTSVLLALWSFIKILLFLLLIFTIVMAFGDAYRISSTNQLLATVAGGLVPFLFKSVLKSSSSSSSVETDDILFQNELHDAILNYQQNWPVFDLVKAKSEESKKQADSQNEGIVMKFLCSSKENCCSKRKQSPSKDGAQKSGTPSTTEENFPLTSSSSKGDNIDGTVDSNANEGNQQESPARSATPIDLDKEEHTYDDNQQDKIRLVWLEQKKK
jgi:hypothetical protein